MEVLTMVAFTRGMEYDDTQRAREVAGIAESFIDDVVLPVEREHLGREPVSAATVSDLRDAAREAGVYAPQIEEEYGGMGMAFRDVLPTFEAAGRSLLGPAAIRVDAPDEGNMHTLEMFGTAEQKERWLRPLVAGELRSAISMTEPIQGGGSDPKMLKTRAERDGDEWVITGHKWWTTQGGEADVLIVMAITDPEAHPYEGASLFLVPSDADGVDIVRDIPHMGGGVIGETHAEIKYRGVRVPDSAVLGELHEGFSHVQARLGPARLTHCMRFAGMAGRALEIAKAYASEREAFGSTLAEKQALRYDIADAATELHAARAMIRHAADEITAGEQGRVPVSMCKVYAAKAARNAIDTAVQVCGANGIGKDLPLADFYENVRWFHMVDGADEVHKRVIARDQFESVDPAAIDGITRFDASV